MWLATDTGSYEFMINNHIHADLLDERQNSKICFLVRAVYIHVYW